jgi:RNA polymerase sigma-70 factor (ECF subfamily)
MMAEQPKARGAEGTGSNQYQVRVANGAAAPALSDAGIDKHLADRARKHAAIPEEERRVSSSGAMSEASRREVRAGLEPTLARLWRYALVLSKARDAADDLVQATCLRAIERADQFIPGTRVDRWLFAILRSIWLNEIRSQRIREGGGFVDAAEALTTDGEREIEMNITAAAVLRAIDRLPEAQRETILLVYGEGYSYAEAAAALGVPIGTIMSRLSAGRAALAKLK